VSWNRTRAFEQLLAGFVLLTLSLSAVVWVQQCGYTLDSGDATAHLNIARRIIDSRTPGYAQVGTVWLPLPHALMLPLVWHDRLWQTGLAGAIPAALCYVLGGLLWFAAVRYRLGTLAAWVATLAYATNPNVLYLQATPMTEPIFFAGFSALLYCTERFRQRQETRWVVAAALAANAASLSRYEGWFLIPFVTVHLWAISNRSWRHALLFGTLASLGPLYWLGHNWWFYGDAWEFYRGPYSAKAIYHRALSRGMKPYPGDGDWIKAIRYYAAAVRLSGGWALVVVGAVGWLIGVVRQRVWWPLVFLGAPAVFYVLSLHSGGTPIFVPHLWPFSYYNTRYGLSALPWLAFGAGLLARSLPQPRWRRWAALGLTSMLLLFWWARPEPQRWVCWKEARTNSEGRRAWTAQAATFLAKNYRGGGIITSFGDLTGIFLQAGIPLKETLHNDNPLFWQAAVLRPDLFLRERWAVTFAGDPVATALIAAQRHGPYYERVQVIAVPKAPVVEIYRRAASDSILQSPRRRQ